MAKGNDDAFPFFLSRSASWRIAEVVGLGGGLGGLGYDRVWLEL